MPGGRLDTLNAALYIGISQKTLAMMRCRGEGPLFSKLCGRVFYRQTDLDAWIDQGGRYQSTAQACYCKEGQEHA